MASKPRERLLLGAVSALAVLTVVAVGTNAVVLLLVPCALVLVIAIITMRRWILPSVSLVLFALVPTAYLSLPPVVSRYLTPAVVIFAVWALMSVKGARVTLLKSLVVIFVTAILIISTLQSSYIVYSAAWSASFLIGGLAPVLVRSDPRAVSALTGTWKVLTLALSLVAMAESIAGTNPLMSFYSFEQHWSVYRITTTLGHPLMNGLFFAVSAALMFGMAMRRGSWLTWSAFLASSAATTLTGSRSGLVALIVGVGVVLVLNIFASGARGTSKLLATLVVGATVAIAPNLPIIAERSDSAEAVGSASARDTVYVAAWALVERNPVFGTGPGSSALVAVDSGIQLPIESAVLGSLVSVGYAGFALLLLMVVVVVVRSVRRGRFEVAGGVAAFAVVGSAFPQWETIPATWLLFGLLSIIGSERFEPQADVLGTRVLPQSRMGRRPTPVRVD